MSVCFRPCHVTRPRLTLLTGSWRLPVRGPPPAGRRKSRSRYRLGRIGRLAAALLKPQPRFSTFSSSTVRHGRRSRRDAVGLSRVEAPHRSAPDVEATTGPRRGAVGFSSPPGGRLQWPGRCPPSAIGLTPALRPPSPRASRGASGARDRQTHEEQRWPTWIPRGGPSMEGEPRQRPLSVGAVGAPLRRSRVRRATETPEIKAACPADLRLWGPRRRSAAVRSSNGTRGGHRRPGSLAVVVPISPSPRLTTSLSPRPRARQRGLGSRSEVFHGSSSGQRGTMGKAPHRYRINSLGLRDASARPPPARRPPRRCSSATPSRGHRHRYDKTFVAGWRRPWSRGESSLNAGCASIAIIYYRKVRWLLDQGLRFEEPPSSSTWRRPGRVTTSWTRMGTWLGRAPADPRGAGDIRYALPGPLATSRCGSS